MYSECGLWYGVRCRDDTWGFECAGSDVFVLARVDNESPVFDAELGDVTDDTTTCVRYFSFTPCCGYELLSDCYLVTVIHYVLVVNVDYQIKTK